VVKCPSGGGVSGPSGRGVSERK